MVLIIGLGSIATKHINALRQIDNTIQICALRTSLNANIIEGVQNIFDYEQLQTKPDFILISNPTSIHRQTILEVLHFECPLFIEKPVFHSLDNVQTIIDFINEKQILTYVACNMRFHPAIVFIKSYLEQYNSRVNEVNIYCGSYLPNWRPNKDFRKIYSAIKELGGGVNLDLIHELDYCTWLFGFPLVCNNLFSSKSSLEINSNDSANFIFQYAEFNANISLNYFRRDSKRTLEIVMDDDTILVDLLSNTVSSLVTGKILFQHPYSVSETYFDQMKYFMKVLETRDCMNDLENGIKVLKLALNE
jgi:predicted dehydrogenase